jgi:two-component system CheB/CheR fusion protein
MQVVVKRNTNSEVYPAQKNPGDNTQQENEFFQSVISALNIPFIILDDKFRIYYQNQLFLDRFDLKRDDIRGHSLFDLDNDLWKNRAFKTGLRRALKENINLNNFELQYNGQDNLVINANGITKGSQNFLLLTLQDITELKKQQNREKQVLKDSILLHENEKQKLEKAVRRRTKQLELKNRELARANKDLESFNYVSSHDLQEPLRKIQSFCTLILKEERKKLSRTGKDYFERMQVTAKRMQLLIEDLLAYSRTKNTEKNFELTNLNDILDEVKEEYKEKIQLKNATITSTKLCTVPIIRFQFRQLFHNLISNSLKFTLEGRTPIITIKSRVASGADFKNVKLQAKTKYCHLTFTDNGIGFDPQYKDRIFEVFQRLHNARDYKGTGIGLAICKRIIENHNGVLVASGKPGKGARFDMYVPVSRIKTEANNNKS